ncbi:MAG: ADP-dependent glucokinase/phosphofructokinase [Bacteroidota bacterium]|nr:ADP-dependent glucokinase/phosphofructokinase [Bacteroidota bacterium]
MASKSLKETWFKHYQTAPRQLKKMAETKGLVSAFNANIDAVKKISGNDIEQLIEKLGISSDILLREGQKEIHNFEDVLRGFIRCFRGGMAEEWLIEKEETFQEIDKYIGYDKMQMGGQGGIVANLMGVCGIDSVYAHCASLPKEQALLFHNLENLQSFNVSGKPVKARNIVRTEDVPLIHFIIEFDKGDSCKIGEELMTCPKANRFIATYDPLNLQLAIDKHFDNALKNGDVNFEHIILSGYQMLPENLPNGKSGIERIDESLEHIKQWQQKASDHILHFEVASTQDLVIRKKLVNTLGNHADSLGFNERELIEILEVLGEDNLAEVCEKNTSASNLFRGMLVLMDTVKASRMQLHMFGLYVTIQRKGFVVTPRQNREGMQLAAVIAASKASTGAVDDYDALLSAKDEKVSDISLGELHNLSDYISKEFGDNQLSETGIFEADTFDLIAVPSIIIDKPVTLVGMGDTISSVSLVGAV